MDDVKHLINRTLSELDQFARQQLNELTGEYLVEVIRGVADDFDLKNIADFNDDEISSVLDRFDERTLTQLDKKNLQQLLKGFHDNPQSRAPKDIYIAHFFAKLGTVARRLQEREFSIRKFVRICNENYLVDKRFVYDRKQFTLQVMLTDGMTVDLKDLSSGEKQIVSLFAHICLNPSDKFIVIIDEPELSLSVDWQENLLPDIMRTQMCEFIAAVTHSPFIYDNEFDSHTVDLQERSSAHSNK